MSIPNINLENEIEDFKNRCAPWFKTEVTEDNAARFRDFAKEASDILAKIEARRKGEKQPHIDAGKAIDAAAQTLAEPIDKSKKFLSKLLTDFATALERRRREEAEAARRAAEEARKAAEAQSDPFAAFDAEQAQERASEAQSAAQERVQIASREGTARAVSLKIVGWIVTVTDAATLVAHFASHPDVIEAARKAAAAHARATKGAVPVPGVSIEPDRKVA